MEACGGGVVGCGGYKHYSVSEIGVSGSLFLNLPAGQREREGIIVGGEQLEWKMNCRG